MKRNTRQMIVGYLFLLPTILFYLIFFSIPILFSLILSFTQWGGFDLTTMTWVGLANYKKLFSSQSTFIHPILSNTILFALGTVFLSLLFALIVSYMITRLRYEKFWRTLYFLPMVTTVVAIGNVWRFMYNPNGGALNGFLHLFGLPPIQFLNNPQTALPSVIVVSAWAAVGGSVLILTAGLKSIPESYYEAARLEGASVWRIFISITLPLLKPSILFVLITGLISGLQSFTLTLVMTNNGGPGNATNVIGLEMYQQAFNFGNWGIASAMAFVLFVIVFAITLAQLMIFKRGGVESY